MSAKMNLNQYTKEEVLSKINAVKSFIVHDEEVDGASPDELISILRCKIADIEGTLEFNVLDINFFRCPDRFADMVIYRLKED